MEELFILVLFATAMCAGLLAVYVLSRVIFAAYFAARAVFIRRFYAELDQTETDGK